MPDLCDHCLDPGRPSVMAPLIPFVIGLIGHRDLREADQASLEDQLRSVFRMLQKRFSSTPLVAVSALAEGADRLAARVALEVGMRLIVPLPMLRAIYEADFTTPGSLEEFSALLARAERWFELPLVEGNDDAKIREPGVARDRQYAALGAYIVEHSQILVALWDGVPSKKLGGTAQTVAFKLQGGGEYLSQHRSPLNPVDTGPVYWIVTPRLSNPSPNGVSFTTHTRFPQEFENHAAAEKVYDRVYARTEGFNRDVLRLAPELAARCEASRTDLLPEEEAARLTPGLRGVRDAYGFADALAVHFQRKTYRALDTLFWGVFGVAVLFAVYGNLWQNFSVLVGYLVALGAVYVLWYVVKRLDYQNKFQDYRTLAEGLRVQFFWGLAGLQCSVATSYLRKQRSELEWIRNALRAVSMWFAGTPFPFEGYGGPEGARKLRLLLRYWVEPQNDYFAGAARRDEATHALFRLSAKMFFAMSLGFSAIAAAIFLSKRGAPAAWFPSVRLLTSWIEVNPWVNDMLTALMALTAVTAALLHNYSEKRALSEHAKHYARMNMLFASAKDLLSDLIHSGAYQSADILLRDLGSEALRETGDWVILHRERPLDLPQAGGATPSVALGAMKKP
jgi:hypothetical protein